MIFATTKERIIQYIDYKGIDRKVFFKQTGLKRGFLDSDKLKSTVSDIFIAKIVAKYPEINIEWLITGNGEMLNPKKKSVNELEGGYGNTNYIPLLPVNAIAGFGSGDWTISDQDIQERYVVPEFNGIDFMIRVKGSSMYPKYNSGDVIACRKLSDTQFIQWNKVYVISTREQGILVKRLDESKQKDCLLAISDNEKYKPFNIPKEDITGMALVIGVIRLE